MKTVLEYITEILVGKQCKWDGDVFTINKVTVDRGQMAVVIENKYNLITVDMDMVQIINAVNNASE